MKLIEQAIESYWGERCSDYEEGCVVCEAWRDYDNLVMDNMIANNLFLQEMVLRNAPPIDPAIRNAISRLIVERKPNDN